MTHTQFIADVSTLAELPLELVRRLQTSSAAMTEEGRRALFARLEAINGELKALRMKQEAMLRDMENHVLTFEKQVRAAERSYSESQAAEPLPELPA